MPQGPIRGPKGNRKSERKKPIRSAAYSNRCGTQTLN